MKKKINPVAVYMLVLATMILLKVAGVLENWPWWLVTLPIWGSIAWGVLIVVIIRIKLRGKDDV